MTEQLMAEANAADNQTLLTVRALKKYFPVKGGKLFAAKQYIHAVDGISFTVKKGRTLGLVGESGCGKTTVGRMIVRLLPATGGEVVFEGQDILKLTPDKMPELRKNVQFIFQDPYASLNPKMKIGSILAEPFIVHHKAKGPDRNKMVEELLEIVGLPKSAAGRYPHEFSGGQRQRVGIARALALKPKLIICDEPVSALDVSIQSQILNLLQELQQSYGLTYIFIAHGLNVIKHISDDVAVMYMGKMMEISPVDELFAHPYHPYTQALLAAIPMPDPEAESGIEALEGDIPSLLDVTQRCRFCTRCPKAQENCFTESPELKEVAPEHFVACFYPQNGHV